MSSTPSRVLERTATRLFGEGPRAPDAPVSAVLASGRDGSSGIGRLGTQAGPGRSAREGAAWWRRGRFEGVVRWLRAVDADRGDALEHRNEVHERRRQGG